MANICPNVQKLDIRLLAGIRLQKESKSNNYSELQVVNQVGIRWKDNMLNYWGLTDMGISFFAKSME